MILFKIYTLQGSFRTQWRHYSYADAKYKRSGGGGDGGTKAPMVVFVFFVKKKLLDVHSTHSIIFHVFRKM